MRTEGLHLLHMLGHHVQPLLGPHKPIELGGNIFLNLVADYSVQEKVSDVCRYISAVMYIQSI